MDMHLLLDTLYRFGQLSQALHKLGLMLLPPLKMKIYWIIKSIRIGIDC
jgi:hypothetical protein